MRLKALSPCGLPRGGAYVPFLLRLGDPGQLDCPRLATQTERGQTRKRDGTPQTHDRPKRIGRPKADEV